MKIIYRQPLPSEDPGALFLSRLGIKHCFFKHLFTERDMTYITLKRHHHTHYEIHIVEKGYSVYEIGGAQYALNCGQFLIIPPQMPHRVILRQPNTSTFSITFRTDASTALLADTEDFVFGEITEDIHQSIAYITSEHEQNRGESQTLIASSLAQILLLLWRISNISPNVSAQKQGPKDDSRLALAIQYIHDNIEYAPTVFEVAAYCHLSTKHLTRLFLEEKGEAPAKYIRKYRAQQLEHLLMDAALSLKEISERMHFSSEYYFHAFFKKYSGMTPGEFRRMHTVV